MRGARARTERKLLDAHEFLLDTKRRRASFFECPKNGQTFEADTKPSLSVLSSSPTPADTGHPPDPPPSLANSNRLT